VLAALRTTLEAVVDVTKASNSAVATRESRSTAPW